jgi:hypothetical protein
VSRGWKDGPWSLLKNAGSKARSSKPEARS